MFLGPKLGIFNSLSWSSWLSFRVVCTKYSFLKIGTCCFSVCICKCWVVSSWWTIFLLRFIPVSTVLFWWRICWCFWCSGFWLVTISCCCRFWGVAVIFNFSCFIWGVGFWCFITRGWWRGFISFWLITLILWGWCFITGCWCFICIVFWCFCFIVRGWGFILLCWCFILWGRCFIGSVGRCFAGIFGWLIGLGCGCLIFISCSWTLSPLVKVVNCTSCQKII